MTTTYNDKLRQGDIHTFGTPQDFAGCPADDTVDIERANPSNSGHEVFMDAHVSASDAKPDTTYSWHASDLPDQKEQPGTVKPFAHCLGRLRERRPNELVAAERELMTSTQSIRWRSVSTSSSRPI